MIITPKKLLFLSLASLVLISCNQLENVATSTLNASKSSNIKRGEPVVFKFSNIPDSSCVVWKVTPEEGVTLNANGSKASALFTIAGSYSINATYANAVINTNVVVTDSVYNPAVNSLTPVVSGDTLKVEAIINDTSTVGETDVWVLLIFTTTYKYDCLNNSLLSSIDPMTGLISFSGVFTPDSKFGSTGKKVAEGSVILNPDPTSRMNRLEISFGGITYKGYYYVSNKQLYIYWPYTDGIIFINAIKITTANN